jgi:hypothetical protein
MGIQPDTEWMSELANPFDEFICEVHGSRILQSARSRTRSIGRAGSRLVGGFEWWNLATACGVGGGHSANGSPAKLARGLRRWEA